MTLPRPYMPLKTKHAVALRMLGFIEGEVEYDHTPALALREFDPEIGRYTPDANDPEYIVIRSIAEHRTKTTGRKGEQRSTSYGSDAHAIAKLRRLAPEQEEFRSRVLRKEAGQPRERKWRWPSRKFPSRAGKAG